MAPAYLEREEEEASPFLSDRQPSGVQAVLRSGLKVALEVAALLACVAMIATLLGVHHGAIRQPRPRSFLGLEGLLQEVEVAENVSGNATGNGTGNATETCPDGYVPTHLDMQNHDADIHEESASLEECAAKCNGDEKCKGFEHNMVAQHCWVSRVGHHCTDVQHEDWISCVKGDSDACDDGSSTSEAASTSEGPSNASSISTTSSSDEAGGASPGTVPATNEASAASSVTVPGTESCPGGFVGTQLDMLNVDADMITASLEDCAAKCNEDEKCKGFEHNLASQICWVSRAGHHCSDEQHEDWISCVKGDIDACEDGGPNDE